MLVNNMAYSRTSLNHVQQKTNLLTIAVIRKRRRRTANMAVACIVSSGEHFCLLFSTFCFCFVFLFFFSIQGKNILGHLKRRFVPQISSQSLKQGYI